MSNSLGDSNLDANASQTKSIRAGLVRRAQGGDTAAFEQLVRAFHRQAISLAYRLLGSIEDAQDVSQEAFVRAFRSLGQLDDPARFGGWLMRIVSNLSLNYRRARRARAAASLDDATTLGEEFRRPTEGGRRSTRPREADGTLGNELQAAITQAVNRLPDQQRLALVMFSVEGMPQKEVAEVLDCSIEMVKWNVFQARKKLQQALAEYL